MHNLKSSSLDKTSFMGLKLDISKAYHKVEWAFLEDIMLKLGFPIGLVEKKNHELCVIDLFLYVN